MCVDACADEYVHKKPQGSSYCSCDGLFECDCDCVKGVDCEVHEGTCASFCACIWVESELIASASGSASASTPLVPLWSGFSYKPHQTVGIEWMLQRELATASGGLVCDEMGLGKTMEILGTIKNSRKLQNLLLCPKAVIAQWRDAAKKSSFNVLEIEGQGWKFSSSYCSGQPFLFITNYDKIASKDKKIFARKWDRIVLDEAHRIRNMRGKLWQSINAMPRKTMWCVTATPIVNELKDIRALFALIGYELKPMTNYSHLSQVMTEACLRRSMEEMRPVLAELPSAPTVKEELLDFDTEEEAEFYRGIQGAVMRRWRALESDQINAMFSLMMRLRQISLHPQVYINARKKEWSRYARDDWAGPSTKFTTLRNKIAASEKPARWIVFCQFHDEMDMLKEFLEHSPAIGLVQMYHGGVSDKGKAEVIAKTFEPVVEKHQVLLLQLQSGGVGLNLQHFTKVIFMSPWWTAALMDQAIGRAVRIGQKETVEVTLLLLKEEETMNIDKVMMGKVGEKRGVLDNLFAYASRGQGRGEASCEEDPE